MDSRDNARRIRLELELTQAAFADRIGLKRNTWTNIEAKRRNLTERVMADICRAFNVSDAFLRYGEGEPFSSGCTTPTGSTTLLSQLRETDQRLIAIMDLLTDLSEDEKDEVFAVFNMVTRAFLRFRGEPSASGRTYEQFAEIPYPLTKLNTDIYSGPYPNNKAGDRRLNTYIQ